MDVAGTVWDQGGAKDVEQWAMTAVPAAPRRALASLPSARHQWPFVLTPSLPTGLLEGWAWALLASVQPQLR